jgi:hypothetical protein
MRISKIIPSILLSVLLVSTPAMAKIWRTHSGQVDPGCTIDSTIGSLEESANTDGTTSTDGGTGTGDSGSGGSSTQGTTLSWSIPTTRENGDALSIKDIAGYEIYYTTDSSGISTTIAVSNPYQTSHTIYGLEPNTYHFAITAHDTNGNQSALSDIVSTTIQ